MGMLRNWAGLAGLVLLALAVDAAGAATWYVSTAGANGNDGTSAATAWRTLQYAVDHTGVQPGDTIRVLPGTYVGAQIDEHSGLPGLPITLLAEPGVVVNAPSPNALHQSLIEVEQVSHWTVRGFEVVGSPKYGIDVRLSSFVEVDANLVHHSALTGIFSGRSYDLTISGNTTHSNNEHGIYHSDHGDRPVITGNLSYGNVGAGIQINADQPASPPYRPEDDGRIDGARITGNIIHDNGVAGGSSLNLDGAPGALVANNLIYGDHASGISLYNGNSLVPSSGVTVCYNTFLLASDSRWVVNNPEPPYTVSEATDNHFFNNILFTQNGSTGSILTDWPVPGLASDYNLVVDRFSTDNETVTSTLSQWQATTGQDLHSLVASPDLVFADWLNGDFRLAPGSPAYLAGNGSPCPDITTDILGAPRSPLASIGAYQQVVPEPSTLALLVLAGPVLWRRRRARRT
jgi:parallel beta-helix repeat protein